MSKTNWILWIIGIIVVLLILVQLNVIHLDWLSNLFSTVNNGEVVDVATNSAGGAMSSIH